MTINPITTLKHCPLAIAAITEACQRSTWERCVFRGLAYQLDSNGVSHLGMGEPFENHWKDEDFGPLPFLATPVRPIETLIN